MRAVNVALALVLGCGCAARQKASAATAAVGARDALQERAAALFDAAVHGDELRLRTLVDWARWRTFDGLAHSRGNEDAAAVLSRLEAEPQPSAAFVDGAAHALRTRLAEVAAGPTPPQACAGVMNAELAAWRRGPAAGAPPSLARLQALVADALDGAREVTMQGSRRVTLVFGGDLLIGVLEAR